MFISFGKFLEKPKKKLFLIFIRRFRWEKIVAGEKRGLLYGSLKTRDQNNFAPILSLFVWLFLLIYA